MPVQSPTRPASPFSHLPAVGGTPSSFHANVDALKGSHHKYKFMRRCWAGTSHPSAEADPRAAVAGPRNEGL